MKTTQLNLDKLTKKLTYSTLFLTALFGLSACSGSSNQSTPAPSQTPPSKPSGPSDKPSTPSEPSDKPSEEGKKVTWRQLTGFPTSNDVAVDDPYNEKQRGKISPDQNAAGYLNGDMRFGNNKDFRKEQDRKEVGYHPDFMNTGKIDKDTLQQYGKDGSYKFHFVNQKDSTYFTWKSESPSTVQGEKVYGLAAGYVAIPTTKPISELKSKGTATYKGHVITNKAKDSKEVHLADLELTANFDKKDPEISGKITNRNDALLDSAAKYDSENLSEYTTKQEDKDIDRDLELVSEEEYNKMVAKNEEIKRTYPTLDITLNPAKIESKNGVVSFRAKDNEGFKYKRTDGSYRDSGVWGGIFAGNDATEVVGEIQGGDNFASFGATEETKQ